MLSSLLLLVVSLLLLCAISCTLSRCTQMHTRSFTSSFRYALSEGRQECHPVYHLDKYIYLLLYNKTCISLESLTVGPLKAVEKIGTTEYNKEKARRNGDERRRASSMHRSISPETSVSMRTAYLDLSHQVENGMTYFPGDPEPYIAPADATPPWRVTQLHIGTHVGTHIDAASHFIPHGKTISQYPLERFLLPGIVVSVPGRTDDEPIGANAFERYLAALPAHGAMLVHTGWDAYWKTERYLRHPYLTHESTQFL